MVFGIVSIIVALVFAFIGYKIGGTKAAVIALILGLIVDFLFIVPNSAI